MSVVSMRAMAPSAMPRAMPTPLIATTRASTSTRRTGTLTDSSAGAMDGATGRRPEARSASRVS